MVDEGMGGSREHYKGTKELLGVMKKLVSVVRVIVLVCPSVAFLELSAENECK